MDEPNAMCFDSSKSLGSDKIAASGSGADCANHVGADRCGNQPELYLGKTETCGFSSNPDIGYGNQAYSAAKGISLHPCNHRVRAGVNRTQHDCKAVGIVKICCVRQLGHALHPI